MRQIAPSASTRSKPESPFSSLLSQFASSGRSIDEIEDAMERIEKNVIVAGILLFLGLLGEYEDPSDGWAHLLVLMGVAGEIAGAFVHSVFAARLRILESRKDREAELTIDRLRKATAEANARALEAQAKLVPSYLFRERRPALIDKLLPYAGQPAVVFLDFDLFRSSQFAIDISDALEKAGWSVIIDDLATATRGRPYENVGVVIESLTYKGRDAQVEVAARTLEMALTEYGYEDTTWVGRNVSAPPSDVSPEMATEYRTIKVFPPDFR